MAQTAWLNIPQDVKPVILSLTAANAVACDYISMKNVQMAWLVVMHTGANDTDLTLTLKEATDVSGTSAQTFATAVDWWLDADAGTTSDTLVRQTAATGITIDPATQNGVVAVFKIDPTKLSAGFDCVTFADSGGHGSNFCCVYALCQMREAQATPATVITD